MTDLNNSSNDESHRNDESFAGNNNDWEAFLNEHQQDLQDVASSRTAKKFDRQAQRQEKQAILSVHDLHDDAFVQGQHGPRDYASSWLDVDNVMDQYGSGFQEPHPDLSTMNRTKLIFITVLFIGIIGIILTVFFPSIASFLGFIFALCILIGAGGLFAQHRGHNDDNPFDDGARV